LTPIPKSEGNLADASFPELIQALHANRWTGQLTLTSSGVGKSVTVQDGRLVFASSTSLDDRLGELLLKRGRISYRQLHDAASMITPSKRLGAILVEQGTLSPKDLVRAVVEQTQDIIYSLFAWTEGRYRLHAGTDNSNESITLRMNTLDLIIEGIFRIQSWSRIERAIGGIDARYVRSEQYESVLSEMSLSFERLSLLTNLNGTQMVEQICDESSLPDFDVCRCLWAFRVIGIVDRADGDSPAAEATPAEDEGLALLFDKE
jgi:hypothetical protein